MFGASGVYASASISSFSAGRYTISNVSLCGPPWIRWISTTREPSPSAALSLTAWNFGFAFDFESWSGAMDASELWRNGARLDGLIGPRFFAGRRVTFDWERHELVFEER